MRIKKINITNLFGMFNHAIDLNLKEHLTIIYGINGIGKTMFFNILDSFFNSNFRKLVKLPFESLEIIFEDNTTFEVKNEKGKFTIKYLKNNNDIFLNVDISKYKTNKIDEKIKRDIVHRLPVNKIGEDEYIFEFSGEILTINEIIDRYSNNFPNLINSQDFKIPKLAELNKLISEHKLYFIETQRLLKFDYFSDQDIYSHSRNIREKHRVGKIETVKNYSEELAQIIKDKHYEYSKLSEKLELSLGKRLMSKKVETISDTNKLKEENKKLEEKREELKAVGLFEDVKNEKFTIPDDIDDLTKAVLSVNIQDMKAKLEIFADLHTKLNIFLDILNNKRFSYKKIAVHPENGFVFENTNGVKLDVTELSSGEQHEIVLFYELLFKVPENSLVLIDEPEISLHIVWQKEFLDDMNEIVSIRNFDILIATHSPQIINGNWGITVQLEKTKSVSQ